MKPTITKNLLFITTASLASNPRLIKELESLKNHFQCTVVCFEHHDWSGKLSQSIVEAYADVKFIQINRKQKLTSTIWSKLRHKIALWLNPFFQNNLCIVAFASNDKTPQLTTKALKVAKNKKVNLVIAHNLGAFYPAIQVARQLDAKLQLDIEDFYPGEALYFNKYHETANRHRLMQAAFKQATTITYASEGIGQKCKDSYTIPKSVKQVTIINSFKAKDFNSPIQKEDDKIRCVWFSQHIGPNRGLEQLFEAAKELQEIEFHLIGNANQAFLSQYTLSDNIHLHPILPQEELHAFLSEMDIGLALERADADENRNICLTNKILAYTQAGLYVLATKTSGQVQFLNTLSYEAGELISKDVATSLSQLDPQVLNLEQKQKRWQQAKALSWEVEQEKLLELISQ